MATAAEPPRAGASSRGLERDRRGTRSPGIPGAWTGGIAAGPGRERNGGGNPAKLSGDSAGLSLADTTERSGMKDSISVAVATVRSALAWLPGWLSALIVVVLLVLVALALHGFGLRLARRSRLGRNRTGHLLIERGAGPTRLAMVLFGIGIAVPALHFGISVTHTLLGVVFGFFLLVVGWAAIAGIGLLGDLYLTRYQEGLGENALARKHVTQVRVLRRASQVLIAIISVGAALMTLPAVRQYGYSLFASAGAAGIIVGLAARPVLSNLLAGIQIALTQPIKIEDAVVIEGEWGWIEDITSTYVVVRIWDWRRLVVPLSRLLEQPFQNWTRESASLIGSVHLYVDYCTPIDPLRHKLEAIVHETKLWDGNVVNLQVVEATTEALQLRALVSARNAGEAWDLRCFVREKLIAYLQADMPQALPRRRYEIENLPMRPPESALSPFGRPEPARTVTSQP
jgi:small-conductance mechanosensitive channel